jgi:CheY-like chemotaxis protein
MTEPARTELSGRRVLLVEDDAVVGLGLVAFLEELGATVIWSATLDHSLAAVRGAEQLDLAFVDLNLDGQMSTPVLDLLLAGEIPVILCTGYDVSAIEPRFRDLPRSEKPFTRAKLRRLIAASIEVEAL